MRKLTNESNPPRAILLHQHAGKSRLLRSRTIGSRHLAFALDHSDVGVQEPNLIQLDRQHRPVTCRLGNPIREHRLAIDHIALSVDQFAIRQSTFGRAIGVARIPGLYIIVDKLLSRGNIRRAG